MVDDVSAEASDVLCVAAGRRKLGKALSTAASGSDDPTRGAGSGNGTLRCSCALSCVGPASNVHGVVRGYKTKVVGTSNGSLG